MFARYGVSHAWLLDPDARRLEVYRLDRGALREVARFEANAAVCTEPFDALALELDEIWD